MNEIIIAYDDSFLDQYDCLPKQIKEKFKKQTTGMKPSALRDCSTYQFRFAFGIGVSRIKALKNNPKHPSLRIHRIKGTEFWEFYVDEYYRCVFNQNGNIYSLFFVGTHKLIDRFNSH